MIMLSLQRPQAAQGRSTARQQLTHDPWSLGTKSKWPATKEPSGDVKCTGHAFCKPHPHQRRNTSQQESGTISSMHLTLLHATRTAAALPAVRLRLARALRQSRNALPGHAAVGPAVGAAQAVGLVAVGAHLSAIDDEGRAALARNSCNECQPRTQYRYWC